MPTHTRTENVTGMNTKVFSTDIYAYLTLKDRPQ